LFTNYLKNDYILWWLFGSVLVGSSRAASWMMKKTSYNLLLYAEQV